MKQEVVNIKKELSKNYHFNVYLIRNENWIFVHEFWSGSDWNLPLGGIVKVKAAQLYNKTVHIKRIS